MRKLLAILSLLVALAIPGSALAASSTGDTTETLTFATSVSLVVPATATYTLTGSTWSTGDLTYTGIATNNPTGMTITAKVDAFTGPATIATTARRTDNHGATGGLTGHTAILAGSWTNATTSKTLATATGLVSGGTLTEAHSVDASFFTAFGVYTSAVHVTATTNP